MNDGIEDRDEMGVCVEPLEDAIGFQGVELLTTGRLSLPMREPDRSYLLDVRRGKVSEQECLTQAGMLERELDDLATSSPLPEAPDEERVGQWVVDAYRRRWKV